jgi:hypothetical protein
VPIDPRETRVRDIGITADDVLAVSVPQGFVTFREGRNFELVRVARAWRIG